MLQKLILLRSFEYIISIVTVFWKESPVSCQNSQGENTDVMLHFLPWQSPHGKRLLREQGFITAIT